MIVKIFWHEVQNTIGFFKEKSPSFHIPHSTFHIPNSTFLIPHCRFATIVYALCQFLRFYTIGFCTAKSPTLLITHFSLLIEKSSPKGAFYLIYLLKSDLTAVRIFSKNPLIAAISLWKKFPLLPESSPPWQVQSAALIMPLPLLIRIASLPEVVPS